MTKGPSVSGPRSLEFNPGLLYGCLFLSPNEQTIKTPVSMAGAIPYNVPDRVLEFHCRTEDRGKKADVGWTHPRVI